VCGGREFYDREVKLNSTGMELVGLAWANQSALGLLCASCGYVHEFVGDAVILLTAETGSVRAAPAPLAAITVRSLRTAVAALWAWPGSRPR
jgi:hypothetical protein